MLVFKERYTSLKVSIMEGHTIIITRTDIKVEGMSVVPSDQNANQW
jgi:hypothetical protein